MKKIYCFNNGGASDLWHASALGEDGVPLASHICSHECFMQNDLGITSTCKHEYYNAHFGEGNWELEWVPTSEIATHPGLQAALAIANSACEPAEAPNDV